MLLKCVFVGCVGLIVGACSNDGGSGASDASGGTDGQGLGTGGASTGTGGGASTSIPAECEGAPASTNPDGVLTPFPSISVSVSPTTFRVATLNFVVTEDGDSRGPLLEMFAEIENAGASTECDFIPSIFLGVEELVGLPDTPPYYDDITSVTSDCVAPGETLALRALARGITMQDVEAATYLSIDLDPWSLGATTPALDAPDLTTEIAQVAGGWGLSGTMTPRTTIYNYGLYVYPRNSQGVLFARLAAYPNNLETLVAGAAFPFETDACACPFDDYVLYHSWILED